MTPRKPKAEAIAEVMPSGDVLVHVNNWDSEGTRTSHAGIFTAPLSSVVAHESQAPAPSNRSPYHVARFGSVAIRFNTETEAFDVVNGDVVLPITAVKVTLA